MSFSPQQMERIDKLARLRLEAMAARAHARRRAVSSDPVTDREWERRRESRDRYEPRDLLLDAALTARGGLVTPDFYAIGVWPGYKAQGD